MVAVLGAHDISKKEPSQQRLEVAKFIPHPKFTSNNPFDYDIMLLKVNTDEHLTTVCVFVYAAAKAEIAAHCVLERYCCEVCDSYTVLSDLS